MGSSRDDCSRIRWEYAITKPLGWLGHLEFFQGPVLCALNLELGGQLV